ENLRMRAFAVIAVETCHCLKKIAGTLRLSRRFVKREKGACAEKIRTRSRAPVSICSGGEKRA
ncbi:MAG: hypothetical protein ACI4P3_05305, partial [Candidatus Spyradosoma sp.]